MQEEWIADWEHENSRCPQCDGDPAVCGDEDVDWFPQRTICYTTAARSVAARLYQERFKDREFHDGTYRPMSEKWSPATPWHYMDGVNIWVSPVDLTPEDMFLGESAAEESPGDED